MGNTVGRLNQKQKSLIIGSMLGDGHMRIIDGRKDAFLEINHSIKAKSYVDYKYFILKNICESEPKERIYKINEVNRRVYRFFTKQLKELTEIYNSFYKNKRKIIPRDLKLDSVSLAVWYMDDGSKTSKNDIYLNTQSFSLNDQKFLLHLLRKTFKIKARLNKDKNYYRIRILKESIPIFMSIIDKEMEKSMRYKMIDKNDLKPVET